jgi:predicted nucleic-acid-binding protein
MVARATAVLASGEELLLADLLVAECVYVLESFYEVPRARVAELMRAAIALPSIRVTHESSLLRALEVYERERLDRAEAYLVAQAEVNQRRSYRVVRSFDRSRRECLEGSAGASRGSAWPHEKGPHPAVQSQEKCEPEPEVPEEGLEPPTRGL